MSEIWRHEWKLHSHDEGSSGAPTRARRPPMGCCPLSYIKRWWCSSPLHTFSPCSLPSLPLAAPLFSKVLDEALHKYFYTTILSRRRRWWSWWSSGGSSTSAPRWNKGTEVINKPYVWPRTDALHVVALYFTILTSTSAPLHHPCSSGTLTAFGLWGWVLLRQWLVRCKPSHRCDLG
jgi:hypothetical protein